ncbi:MAG: hypothetical protein ACI8TQ_001140 [Planctomycetota bacterium]|jgi:hypothetical protein
MSNSNRFNRKRFALGTVLVVACATAVVTAFDKRREVASETFAGSSAEVHSILAALPIELTKPFTHDWSAERAPVQTGWLLALEVEPEMLVPHQVADPVLYVGDQAVERINRGDESGRVIVIVPKRVDLSSAPIYFGTAALPESVDATTRSAELSLARQNGAKAFSAATLELAYEKGLSGSDTEVVEFADRHQLLDFAAQWIYEYCPDESDFASKLLRIPSGK